MIRVVVECSDEGSPWHVPGELEGAEARKSAVETVAEAIENGEVICARPAVAPESKLRFVRFPRLDVTVSASVSLEHLTAGEES